MNAILLNAFGSEWLKLKRSAVLRLCIAGAFVVPVIMIIAAFASPDRYQEGVLSENFWVKHYHGSWQFMNMFLLPLGIILIISLLLQLEHSSSGWRQQQLLPVKPVVTYSSKFAVILVLAVLFVTLFSIGIYISGILPAAFMSNVDLPAGEFPMLRILKRSLELTAACLPVVTLQFVLCMTFRNFMLPMGIGIALFVASLISVQWKYGGVLPYTWPALEFMKTNVSSGYLYPQGWIPYTYSAAFLVIGFVIYRFRKIKD
ncbi:MAG: ABC transporter permease [Bacteroidia bacterium]